MLHHTSNVDIAQKCVKSDNDKLKRKRLTCQISV